MFKIGITFTLFVNTAQYHNYKHIVTKIQRLELAINIGNDLLRTYLDC